MRRPGGGPVAGLAVLGLACAVAEAGAQPRDVDLLVRNGTAVTMDADRRVLPAATVAVDGGRIVAVGAIADVEKAFRGRTVLDAGGGIILPGLINAHTHAPMVLFRGVADDLRLMEWLQKYIFPAEAKTVSAEMVRAGTRLAALEMIRSGTTTFVDMYYFEDQVAEAAKEAGIRGVLGETIIEVPGGAPDNKTIPDALAYTERFLKRWAGDPLVTAAVAPHSPFLCSPETVTASRDLANRYRAPILTHLSETKAEQDLVRERYGKTPTEHLRDLGLLRRGALGAHGVWLSAGDRAVLKSADAGIAHCPQSNMKLASGAAPVREMLAEGVRLGLGTDGAASNNDLDMFEEMMTAALLAKHASGDPTAGAAPAILEMATLGGARALGMEDRLGSLEVGKRADLVVVDVAHPRLTPLYEPVSHLVYAVKGADVRHVVIDGRIVMRDRRVLTLDDAAVRAAAGTWRQRILAAVGR